MLILGRKAGESVVIGDHISITILTVEANGNVTLGIDAPKDLLILRRELQQAVSLNQQAAHTAPSKLINALGSVLIHEKASSHTTSQKNE